MDWNKDLILPVIAAVVAGVVLWAMGKLYGKYEKIRQKLGPLVIWFEARPWLVAGLISLGISLPLSIWNRSSALIGAKGDQGAPGVQGAVGPRGLAGKDGDNLPQGTVVAFNLSGGCPSGWRPFTPGIARFIIGAGTPSDPQLKKWRLKLPAGGYADKNLTPRALLEAGGEEQHLLSIQEMPSHTHRFTAIQNATSACLFGGCSGYGQSLPEQTEPQGGDQPHDVMPPFVALTFCER